MAKKVYGKAAGRKGPGRAGVRSAAEGKGKAGGRRKAPEPEVVVGQEELLAAAQGPAPAQAEGGQGQAAAGGPPPAAAAEAYGLPPAALAEAAIVRYAPTGESAAAVLEDSDAASASRSWRLLLAQPQHRRYEIEEEELIRDETLAGRLSARGAAGWEPRSVMAGRRHFSIPAGTLAVERAFYTVLWVREVA